MQVKGLFGRQRIHGFCPKNPGFQHNLRFEDMRVCLGDREAMVEKLPTTEGNPEFQVLPPGQKLRLAFSSWWP